MRQAKLSRSKPILSGRAVNSGAIREDHDRSNKRQEERIRIGKIGAYRDEVNDQILLNWSEGKRRKTSRRGVEKSDWSGVEGEEWHGY